MRAEGRGAVKPGTWLMESVCSLLSPESSAARVLLLGRLMGTDKGFKDGCT